MIFNFIIILLLIYGAYTGLQVGLAGEILRVVGFMFSLLISLYYARSLSQILFSSNNLTNNQLLCNSISFLIIFLATRFLCRVIIQFVNKITRLPIIHEFNALGGALISFLLTYLSIFLVLNVLLVIPNNQLKKYYYQSSVAEFIVNDTPMISHDLFTKWLR